MNSHLPVLMSMFPGKTFLDVDDIAKCMSVSKAHIYRLSSKNELKVRTAEGSDRLLVSIVEMANYLDSQLSDFGVEKKEQPKVEEPPPVHTLIVRAKSGRRKTSLKQQMSFQSQLSLAIMRVEVENSLSELQKYVDELSFSDDDRKCAEKFDEAKSDVRCFVQKQQSSLMYSYLQLTTPVQDINENREKPFKA